MIDLSDFQLAASWRRGEIWLNKEKNIAVKKALSEEKVAAINKERQLLLRLKKLGINFVPQIIDYGEGWFAYKRIPWIHLIDFLKKYPEKEKPILQDLLTKAYILDKVWIVHWELIRPFKNVIVGLCITEDLYIIDFERWATGNFSWKNLRSYAQFLLAKWYLTIPEAQQLANKSTDEIYKFLKERIEWY